MRLADFYPLVMTENLAAARDFYVRWFDFTPAFEADWCVYLRSPGEPGFALMFIHPDHPSRPPGREVHSGEGLILTMQVEDAAEAFSAMTAKGLPILHGLADEPWGQRRFLTRDPAGVWVDVVEQIAPAEGFWERHGAISPPAA